MKRNADNWYGDIRIMDIIKYELNERPAINSCISFYILLLLDIKMCFIYLLI